MHQYGNEWKKVWMEHMVHKWMHKKVNECKAHKCLGAYKTGRRGITARTFFCGFFKFFLWLPFPVWAVIIKGLFILISDAGILVLAYIWGLDTRLDMSITRVISKVRVMRAVRMIRLVPLAIWVGWRRWDTARATVTRIHKWPSDGHAFISVRATFTHVLAAQRLSHIYKWPSDCHTYISKQLSFLYLKPSYV